MAEYGSGEPRNGYSSRDPGLKGCGVALFTTLAATALGGLVGYEMAPAEEVRSAYALGGIGSGFIISTVCFGLFEMIKGSRRD